MKGISSCLLTAFIIPSLVKAISIWPIPQYVEVGNAQINIHRDFDITGSNVHYLQRAINRYQALIAKEKWLPVQVVEDQEKEMRVLANASSVDLKALRIFVKYENVPLEYGVDESYELDVPIGQETATLISATVWGALRGLETFSQLIRRREELGLDGQPRIVDYGQESCSDDDSDMDSGFEDLHIPYVPIKIRDSPKFSHRGLMLDTSRNFFPIKDILRTLDAMSYNKMNVFHWHITDSHSFPLKLENSPELAEHGAYNLFQKKLLYTTSQVKKVVDYAYERGIRVIPEIDMPAHTGSWGKAHKEITTCTDNFYLDETEEWSRKLAAEPGAGQLNPILDETYEVVERVIKETASLFTDGWFHGGGDEPVYKCWEQDKKVLDYMHTHNATGQDLLHMFLEKELDIILDSNKTVILWEDAVTNVDLPLPKNVVLQSWANPVAAAVKKGYRTIASNAQFWYLDCGHGGWSGNDHSYDEQVAPEIDQEVINVLNKHGLLDNYRTPNWGGSGGDWCSPYKTWQRIYSYDLTFNLTEAEATYVLGGEVALWTEQVDPTTLDTRLWPRSSAAAEVLWSGRFDENEVQRDVGDAMPRMFDWRYRMLKRGIQTEALQPLWW
ncbi:glycoside hydrolase superfamily [Choanephora cucurbitarum]|nr:glycoside hydrolase superfamily [Choanephora cucurbitarum]